MREIQKKTQYQNYSEEDGFYTYQISKKDLAFANIDDLTKSKINS